MSIIPFIVGAAGGLAVVGGGISAYAATKLFNKTIPRQDGVKVDTNEMADAEKWEVYKKFIGERKEWFMAQNLEKVSITSKDNLKLSGIYLPAEKTSDYIVLALHGYTSTGTSFCSLANYFHNIGFDCLMPDLRAHGESEGEYVGFGILDRFDCLEWIKYIVNKFGKEKKIIIHGISMGGATALMTTGFEDIPEQVKAVIADCAFTSPYDVFAHIMKRDYKMSEFPVMNINTMLCRKKAGYGFNDYSTLTAVKNTKLPILFIHGKNDDFVPVWMTEKNYEACVSPKKILMVENAGHGAAYYENHELYEKTVSEFLDEYVFNK